MQIRLMVSAETFWYYLKIPQKKTISLFIRCTYLILSPDFLGPETIIQLIEINERILNLKGTNYSNYMYVLKFEGREFIVLLFLYFDNFYWPVSWVLLVFFGGWSSKFISLVIRERGILAKGLNIFFSCFLYFSFFFANKI